MYGDANQYNKIFDANKPLLSDPNKIYPGQVLRIPALILSRLGLAPCRLLVGYLAAPMSAQCL